jgi:hypothetical protein
MFSYILAYSWAIRLQCTSKDLQFLDNIWNYWPKYGYSVIMTQFTLNIYTCDIPLCVNYVNK